MHTLIESLTCPNALFIYFSWAATLAALAIAGKRYQD